ncbi:hypothetical protein CDL12_20540 [Handroanthus impetiginosus]|uniref:Late embryogenesis abundant protein LEA-2 subgroup domain-containing protein n=1 Tax=Handroanthus impetiginosus TaxID=429701 RepID=A0A2G9GNL5_9LAMI|nr:hypothetical protein CDL12_20540 [Handroanthus impetiginosus]
MADPRVHPSAAAIATAAADPTQSSSSAATSSKQSDQIPKPPIPPPSNPIPPPPAYVVQLPREQILRYPPPENARKIEAFKRHKNRRSCCRRCCCCTLCLLLFLIVAAAVSAGVMYLVFNFKSPKYTVTNISINGMNLTSAAPISPGFDVSIRAENPNGKVSIYYLNHSAVNVFYKDVKLSDGVLPAFYQPKKNVTVLRTSLRGSDVVFGSAVKTALRNGQKQGKVPLVLNVEAPVKIKVGSVKTWEITVKVKCDVVVDALNKKANILSKDCDYSVRLW